MRALVKARPGRGLDLLDVPEPEPGVADVLIEVGVSAVCGSDVARYTWSVNYEAGQPKDMTRDLPRVLGHEFAGTVLSVGADVLGLAPGDRVAVQNVLSCGRCSACAVGAINVCDERRTIGVHVDGGFAERASVPAANCSLLPEGTSMVTAAALQPFAVATHAVTRAGVVPGGTLAVWGLGPIGVAACLAARLRGVLVTAFDLDAQRVAEAREAGIAAFVTGSGTEPDDVLAPRSTDAFLDASGALSAVLGHVSRLRKRGAVVMVGNVRGSVPLPATAMVMDEQRLVGSRSYDVETWRRAVETIGRSGFPVGTDDAVGLDEAVDRFELAATPGGRPFSVLPNGHPDRG